ncbi:hypothetical protein [Orenia metallireducens]|jgi:hypothetical protein|nr:hypothetical protein [Orenia metallireducens]
MLLQPEGVAVPAKNSIALFGNKEESIRSKAVLPNLKQDLKREELVS